MKLLTKKLEERFIELGSQEQSKDPLVVCRFFDPCGAATWLLFEYLPNEGIFFGWCNLFGASCDWELGYVSLKELQSVKGRFDIGIERDLYFVEKPISQMEELPQFCRDIHKG